MAGLVPAIHVFSFDFGRQDVDARGDKRRHDAENWSADATVRAIPKR
jgi:hypothetical protein